MIATGMAKDPDQRYATTVELASAAHDAITTPLAAPSEPTLLADAPRRGGGGDDSPNRTNAAQQQLADLNLAATQQRPPGGPPAPPPPPADRPPPQSGHTATALAGAPTPTADGGR